MSLEFSKIGNCLWVAADGDIPAVYSIYFIDDGKPNPYLVRFLYYCEGCVEGKDCSTLEEAEKVCCNEYEEKRTALAEGSTLVFHTRDSHLWEAVDEGIDAKYSITVDSETKLYFIEFEYTSYGGDYEKGFETLEEAKKFCREEHSKKIARIKKHKQTF